MAAHKCRKASCVTQQGPSFTEQIGNVDDARRSQSGLQHHGRIGSGFGASAGRGWFRRNQDPVEDGDRPTAKKIKTGRSPGKLRRGPGWLARDPSILAARRSVSTDWDDRNHQTSGLVWQPEDPETPEAL